MLGKIKVKDERITIFAGHYGSGKTSIAINYAIGLKNRIGHGVALADLDIINPYFRANNAGKILSKSGVNLITPAYAGTNLEAPSIPDRAVSLFDDKNIYGVIDLGGDDRGAVAIGRYKKRILDEESKNILLVINCYRPLSRNACDIANIKNEIEASAGFCFTGIVNNSNLGGDTRPADLLGSLEVIAEASDLCSLPVMMTCADNRLATELQGKIPGLFGLRLGF